MINKKNIVFLGLGSNRGGREENLAHAQDFLRGRINILKTSSIYETEPVGEFADIKGKKAGWFLNMVLCGETELTPQELLKFIHGIEVNMGRAPRRGCHPELVSGSSKTINPEILKQVQNDSHIIASKKYFSRSIDTDILFYNDLISGEPNLVIPHPQIPFRGFVLHPLAQIAPKYLHPILKKTIKQLLSECPYTSIVRPL